MNKAEWRQALSTFVRKKRAEMPAADRKALDARDQAIARVHNQVLVQWDQNYLPRALDQRQMYLERLERYERDPVRVLHGDPVVLAVLRTAMPTGEDVVHGRSTDCVGLLSSEYEAFAADNPEGREFEYHLHMWTRFRAGEPADLEQAEAMGLEIPAGTALLVHEHGTLWGPRKGLSVRALWSWDGKTLELLEEGEAVSF